MFNKILLLFKLTHPTDVGGQCDPDISSFVSAFAVEVDAEAERGIEIDFGARVGRRIGEHNLT